MEAVRAAVKRLPLDCQSVVLLHFGAGLRCQEIANLLGMPLGTVRLAAHVDGV
jgi:DNA-directed RNA polymerase specialized sigma24 family protein